MLAAPGAAIDVVPGAGTLLANIGPDATIVVEPGTARFVAP